MTSKKTGKPNSTSQSLFLERIIGIKPEIVAENNIIPNQRWDASRSSAVMSEYKIHSMLLINNAMK